MASNSERRQTFAQWQAFEESQQKREIEDLSFYEGIGQWPDDIAALLAGQPAQGGLPAVPASPMITVNKVREPIRHVVNEERAADIGVEIVPADDFGDASAIAITDEEIELREGLVRRIQRESHAIDARIWAAERATIAGRGYYGVMTRYLAGKTNDQEIYLRRFYDQGGILLDPAHEEPDGSDTEGAFVPTWVPYEQYRAEYPKRDGSKTNSLINLGESDLKTLSAKLTDWFRGGDKKPWMVRVVEQWVYERTTRGLATLTDGSVHWEDEIKGLPRDQIEDVREVIDKKVKFYLLDGEEHGDTPLMKTDWQGKYIPIIKVVGEEMQPFDAQRRFEGMVRPSRDSQRGFNYMISKWVKMIGLTPVPPLMLTPQHVEGFTGVYDSMATRAWPWLPYNDVDPITGRQLPPPIRPPIATDIAAIAGSVQLFDQAIRSTTGVPDPSLGNVDPAVKSGKGINALTMNALKATAHFGDNFQRSVNYEGRILNDLLYPIYGRRHGRTARLYTQAREQKTVQVSVQGQPPPMPPQGQPQDGQQPEQPKVYTLTPDTVFNVAIKVTKNYDTLREQEASTIAEAVNAAPEFMLPLVGDLAFKYQDGPGHEEVAERMKFGLRPEVQASLEGGQNGQVQQLQQQIQQLTQQLQSKVAEKQAEAQAKGQIDLQKTQFQEQAENQRTMLKLQSDERAQALDNLVKLAIAEIQAQSQQAQTDAEQARTELGFHQAQHSESSDRVHEAVQNHEDRAHEAVQNALDRQATAEQAAMAPEPA